MECERTLKELASAYRKYLSAVKSLREIAREIGFPESIVRRLPITMIFARAEFKDGKICYTDCYDIGEWLEKMNEMIRMKNRVRSLFESALYYCEKEGKI